MLEIIQQNPFYSLLIILVPIVVATWKIMDVLFVKPRDFRISVLEKNVDEIRRELQKNALQQSFIHGDSVSTPDIKIELHDKPISTSKESLKELTTDILNKSEPVIATTKLLEDFNTFCKSWNDKSLTDLQRDQFAKNYIGQKVVWNVRLSSVSEERDGNLWCGLTSTSDDFSLNLVIAIFESNHKHALLMVNKGEVVKVSGTIDSFSLSPVIKKCSISKST